MSDMWKTVDSVVPDTEEVKVPLFNVADDGDSTQESLAKAVAQVWGIRYGFVNSTIATLVQQFAKVYYQLLQKFALELIVMIE